MTGANLIKITVWHYLLEADFAFTISALSFLDFYLPGYIDHDKQTKHNNQNATMNKMVSLSPSVYEHEMEN